MLRNAVENIVLKSTHKTKNFVVFGKVDQKHKARTLIVQKNCLFMQYKLKQRTFYSLWKADNCASLWIAEGGSCHKLTEQI